MAAAFFAPLARDPDGTRMGRTTVGAGDPDIGVSVPAVIPGHPDPSGMRRRGDYFNGVRRGWSNTHDDLRVGSADREKECAGCGEKLLLHASFSF
jgi:hypothetical protein